jgi:hypothetical protein
MIKTVRDEWRLRRGRGSQGPFTCYVAYDLYGSEGMEIWKELIKIRWPQGVRDNYVGAIVNIITLDKFGRLDWESDSLIDKFWHETASNLGNIREQMFEDFLKMPNRIVEIT